MGGVRGPKRDGIRGKTAKSFSSRVAKVVFTKVVVGCPRVNCFHAAESFILDTGCGKDLVGQRHVAHLQQHGYQKDPFLFRAANGGSTAFERALLSVEPLATLAEPCILDSTPAVLSVGLRIKQGYSFVWLQG